MPGSKTSRNARVYVLYTGGTIGMAPVNPSVKGSPLVPRPIDALQRRLPDVSNLGIDCEYATLDTPVDSSDLGPSEWVSIAKRIQERYEEYDGFVILEGTDTMSYTASALAFLFENLGKPVVLTGSTLPLYAERSDATWNLVNAISVAGYRAIGLPCIPEVVVVFAEKILRGCRTRKMRSGKLGSLDSPNLRPLGTIGERIVIDTEALRPMPQAGKRLQASERLSDEVISISLYPGMSPTHLRKILELNDVSGVVLQTFGAGNAPADKEFLRVIERAKTKRITIVNVSQCPEGTVEMGLYEASTGLLDRGVLTGLDMTPEAALTKLMWSLAVGGSEESIASRIQVNQRGEQSENQFDMQYGGCGSATSPQASFCGTSPSDRRLIVSDLVRASVRLVGLGLANAREGEQVGIRVFLNLPSASSSTPAHNPRCLAEMHLGWKGRPNNETIQIDTRAFRRLTDNTITLSVVADAGKELWFQRLYLSMVTRAQECSREESAS